MSLATRSLGGKSHLMEEPLALSYTEGDGIMLLEVEREQQAIPQVLIISQFSGRPLYLLSQSLLIRRGKPTGAPWASLHRDVPLRKGWLPGARRAPRGADGSIALHGFEISRLEWRRQMFLHLESLFFSLEAPPHWFASGIS